MDDPTGMDWKRFTISLIDSLRWPAAVIAIAVIFREPLFRLFNALSSACGA